MLVAVLTGRVQAQGTLPGDANGDCKVDGVDFVVVFNHYGLPASGGVTEGDFNGDGKVDGVDYVILLNHYGWVCQTVTATPTRVPTPTATRTPTPTLGVPTDTPTRTPTPIANVFNPVRFLENPIIKPDMLPGTDGNNINGPSLIKAPDWIPNKLGSYYLYLAHHNGKYIRLAYSNNLHGPWNVYTAGTLKLSQTTGIGCSDHIASPDVHVDNVKREIRMYFHCPYGGSGQRTFVAISIDGINFTAQPQVLGLPYFRVFEHRGYYYAIGKNSSTSSVLYRSTDPYSGFIRGKAILNSSRHTAVFLNGDIAYIFYSRIGDAPERILLSTMDIIGDWSTWTPSAPVEVIKSEYDYEGVSLPIAPSDGGEASGPVHQLRDPGVYEEAGKLYLLYSVAGEQGIGVAELR